MYIDRLTELIFCPNKRQLVQVIQNAKVMPKRKPCNLVKNDNNSGNTVGVNKASANSAK